MVERVADTLGMTPLINNSWSGSFVTNGSGSLSNNSSSGLNRCQNLHNGSTNPDVIFIYMGTNDFYYNTSCTLGSVVSGTTMTIPTFTSSGFSDFTKAYACLLATVIKKYPNAEIYCCHISHLIEKDAVTSDLNYAMHSSQKYYIKHWNDKIDEICKYFGIKTIDFDKCDINYFNRERYAGDYSQGNKNTLHPNGIGHEKMAEKAIHTLLYGY